MKQVQLHCRVCAKRLLKTKTKCTSTILHCKAYAAKLQTAFDIDTNNDDNRVHPEHVCLSCNLSLDRTVSAIHKNIHYKRSTAPFQWEMYSDLECKVGDYTCAHVAGYPVPPLKLSGRTRYPRLHLSAGQRSLGYVVPPRTIIPRIIGPL